MVNGVEDKALFRFLLDAKPLGFCYWRIRNNRMVSLCQRTWYRKAAKEKGHLVALGWSPEIVRLYAFYLQNPDDEKREKRFRNAFIESLQMELF